MRQVVLDTNILVSALWSEDGKCAKIVEMVLYKEVVLVYSAPIMAEYKKVLNRPKFSFSGGRIERFLTNIEKLGILVYPEKSIIEMIDESDRIFYDAAKESHAILITGNLKHFPIDTGIISPGKFLETKE